MLKYSIGLDYGTNSVRGLLVDVASGEEIACSVFEYPDGDAGILLDPRDPNVARQNPQDYIDGAATAIRDLLASARDLPGFNAAGVIGIGVDTTGSTPLPVDAEGTALGLKPEFRNNMAAMAVLWKDHTAHEEAAEITALAAKIRPQFLAKCGGIYSAEWFWAKILHNLRATPDVAAQIYTWVEHADWMPAVLTGNTHPDRMKRGICGAGHKAMYHTAWGGYPDEAFLAELDPGLARIRRALPDTVYPIGVSAGGLSDEWADRTGLPAGLPVSVGAFDAHLGAVGAGITPHSLVKIIGTSTCDVMVSPLDSGLGDLPGLCGIVPESVLPGYFGLEAGQSAVGDIFNWFVNSIQPGRQGHDELTADAEKLSAGESGLLALDWHNGNRTILVDQRLTGGIIGLTLHTTPAEIYRALIEATAFGARVIMERLEEAESVERIINCGGIAAKNPMVMQIYADVMGRPITISGSRQTCALGAAISGAVVAGAYPSFGEAVAAMTSLHPRVFTPEPESRKVYDRLFGLYRRIHDAFGVKGASGDLYDVMKDLLTIRDEARNG